LVAFLPNKTLDKFLACPYNGSVLNDVEEKMYTCDGRKFKRLKTAVAYAAKAFAKTGVVLGIEPVVVLNKNPGYVAYLAKGMKL
jgi:hypothetical protein